MKKKLLVVGTLAYDSIETPYSKVSKILGGASTYIVLAASKFSINCGLVSVIGKDFKKEYISILESHNINCDGVELIENGKTFFWSGKYHQNMNSRTTIKTELNVLEIEEEDILVRAEKGIKLAKQTLKKVRSIIVDYEFKTKSEEIHFFKCTKPKIYSKLIYYVKLFNIEGKRPRGSNKSQVKYLNNYIEKLQTYFNDNLDFYHYYRREATVFDEQYFLRGKADIRLFPDSFHFFVDEQFATSHDSTVATILAYDLLIVHLKREIDKLENNGNYASLRLLQSKTKITWTAHKIYLIELITVLVPNHNPVLSSLGSELAVIQPAG